MVLLSPVWGGKDWSGLKCTSENTVGTLTVWFRRTDAFVGPLNITMSCKPLWILCLGLLALHEGFLFFASNLVLAIKMDTHVGPCLTCTPQSWIPQILEECPSLLAGLLWITRWYAVVPPVAGSWTCRPWELQHLLQLLALRLCSSIAHRTEGELHKK